ncbi:hypothetical protein BU24DRAFT_189190 [Aaosphaeria arxii CBS 175.79]|uniref:Uncharacterized protein n=1 Tax=Aaosphaeria arxii CBS 175.79 TaxID=1450172 RepID=A0A6A5XTF4_9PLEO|nr:uncharacterized protein BU24DRAFT_189190 [Aaosphaeria arxii CBS 175.79]KAF2015970.1 hypothetical protein BU24DRAFT_189190 [Aaosphaeria arxii CBS 175.79]
MHNTGLNSIYCLRQLTLESNGYICLYTSTPSQAQPANQQLLISMYNIHFHPKRPEKPISTRSPSRIPHLCHPNHYATKPTNQPTRSSAAPPPPII